jgi:hypothetical protein
MGAIKTEALSERALNLGKMVAFLAPMIIFPLFHSQFMAGPMVNAVLFVMPFFLSLRDCMVMAMFPSLVALSVGLLPAVSAPFLPYIIVSNWLLLFVFDKLRQKGYWLGAIISSLAKFLFLYGASFILTSYFVAGPQAKLVANMFSLPQLYTALLGAVIAYTFLKIIRRI